MLHKSLSAVSADLVISSCITLHDSFLAAYSDDLRETLQRASVDAQLPLQCSACDGIPVTDEDTLPDPGLFR